MRLELMKGINNCYLLDGSLSNDFESLQIAIDLLKNHPGQTTCIILSDIHHSGIEEKELYQQLNEILVKNQINSMIGIGEGMMRNASLFSIESEFFRTTDQFLEEKSQEDFNNEIFLIKGELSCGFEKISDVLSEKTHKTVLEINLDAVTHNLNYYKSKLKEGVKLMVMVKAAGYGSSSIEIANLLQLNQVDYLAVAYTDEGVELRKHGIEMPIMVMNVAPESFRNILKYNLEPEVYSVHQLKQLINFINNEEKGVKIHIEIDSGMHRLGFEEKQIDELVNILKENPSVQVESLYAHLSGADEEKHNDFTKDQVTKFLKLTDKIE